jgi:hypothetical protein
VLIGSIIVAGGLIVLIGLLITLVPVPAQQPFDPSRMMTIIPAPSPSPTPTQVLETATPTSPPAIDGISIGSYVQITGTDGQGLRLRSGPGTDHPPRFLGMDAEVFQVKDGPEQSDGFTWWFLEAPYDPGRSGWAASNFLGVVNPPESQ